MDLQQNIPDVVMDRLGSKEGDHSIALVGASTNPAKFGNKIMRNLTSKGYDVIPINPRERAVEGVPALDSPTELGPSVALVCFVVPPAVTLEVFKSMLGTAVDAVWFQDGSFDDQVLEHAMEHFDYVVHDACIMVVTNYT